MKQIHLQGPSFRTLLPPTRCLVLERTFPHLCISIHTSSRVPLFPLKHLVIAPMTEIRERAETPVV